SPKSTTVSRAAVTSALFAAFVGATSTTASARSAAVIVTLPAPTSTTSSMGSGVSKGRMSSSCFIRGLSRPASIPLWAAGPSPFRMRRRVVAIQRGRRGAHEPGVDRDPLRARGMVDARLELFGHAHVDARRTALVVAWALEVARYVELGI